MAQQKRINSLIPASSRRLIMDYLMKEGTIVVRKDPKQPKHEALGIPNLHVMLTLRSMKSRNLVEEEYNWRYLYYVLNNEGIEYLRQQLQLPSAIFPATLTQKSRVMREGGPARGARREF